MANQNNATDIQIKNLEIRSATGRYNLLPHMQELSVYEDIFSPALQADMVIADSHNIPYKLPIVGEETVDIDISLTGYSDGKDSEIYSIKPPPMHVNSLSARSLLDPKQPKAQRFTLEMISESYMSNLHSRISTSYNNNTISDIVSDIYYKYIYDNRQELNIEPTERNERIIIPNLKPFDAINWLALRAIPSASSGVSYLYFETMRGAFFISIDSLAQEEPIFKFIHRSRIDDAAGVEHGSAGEIKIKDYKFIKQFDKALNTSRGVYASKLITHDIVNKKITQYEYGGFNDWFGYSHCGDFPPLSNSEVETRSSDVIRTSFAPNDIGNTYPTTNERFLNNMVDSKVEFYPKHNQMYAKNINDIYDNKVEDWKQKRSGHIGVYDNISILLEVAGNSALRVGHTVTVILPSPETTGKDKKSEVGNDKFLSGKYLVTAIRHIFIREKDKFTYNMKVEVSKDGLEDVVSSRLSRKED
jgi:hypothetical protein